jgi:hypothetical protein
MNKVRCLLILCVVMLTTAIAAPAQDEEISLYESDGTPVAYVAFGDDAPTIYMWSGKPVAYLADTSGDGSSIYGFNGKHLGWFVKGIARDHDGDAACGIRQVVNNPKPEPIKSLKELLPLKSLKELEPLRPLFTLEWSGTPCAAFLYEGAE